MPVYIVGMKNNIRTPATPHRVDSTSAFVGFFLVLILFVPGCNSGQIADLEDERARLEQEAIQTQDDITAMKRAHADAMANANDQATNDAAAAVAMLEKKAKQNKSKRDQNKRKRDRVSAPNEAIADTAEAVSPFLPAPWGGLLQVITTAIIGGAGVGEVARRRGNRKVAVERESGNRKLRTVGRVLETSGAVSFRDDKAARFAAGEMGADIDAEIARGRNEAKTDMARHDIMRGNP